MQRTHSIALVAVLVVVALPGLTAAADTDVTISSVAVTPSDPVPGDDVTVETTIENLDDAGFFVDRVAILEADADDPEEYADVHDIGTIPAGESNAVSLSTSFEEDGSYDVRVKVWGRPSDGGERTTLQYPVTIDVRDRQPQVDVDANDTAVGVDGHGAVTVANSLGNEIEDVELTVDGETVAITNEREVLATLASGDSRSVSFQYRPSDPGAHELNATVRYTTAGGTTDAVSATTTVRAETRRPQIDVRTNDSTAGFETDGTVEVANSVGAALRNVEVTVDGDDVSVRNDRAVYTSVADGDSVTSSFDFEAADPGTHELNATVSYTTGGGAVRSVSETVAVETEAVTDRVSLDVSADEGTDSQRLAVDVLNQGNAPLTNVSVRGASENATVRRALLERVPEGETRTVRLNTSLSADRATVDVTTTYDLGARRGSADATTTLSQTPGSISLTGVQAVPENGRLRISGSASNVGTTDAQSVVVSVVDTERVDPAAPNREFFVGPVPASDFVSFDVYASVDGNASTIPLEVRYLVDGERRTRLVEADAADATRAASLDEQRAQTQSGGPPLVPIAVGAVVALGAIGLMVRAWRASRGGD